MLKNKLSLPARVVGLVVLLALLAVPAVINGINHHGQTGHNARVAVYWLAALVAVYVGLITKLLMAPVAYIPAFLFALAISLLVASI